MTTTAYPIVTPNAGETSSQSSAISGHSPTVSHPHAPAISAATPSASASLQAPSPAVGTDGSNLPHSRLDAPPQHHVVEGSSALPSAVQIVHLPPSVSVAAAVVVVAPATASAPPRGTSGPTSDSSQPSAAPAASASLIGAPSTHIASLPPPMVTESDIVDVANPNKDSKRCNCKKSRCLKLYCECFAASVFCKDCTCKGCHNLPGYEHELLKAREYKMQRRPRAFEPKFLAKDPSSVLRDEMRHSRGCNCRKSGCTKKYCECYQNGVACNSMCKCHECRNDGSLPHLRNFGVSEWRLAAETTSVATKVETKPRDRPAFPADFVPGQEPTFTFVPFSVAQQMQQQQILQQQEMLQQQQQQLKEQQQELQLLQEQQRQASQGTQASQDSHASTESSQVISEVPNEVPSAPVVPQRALRSSTRNKRPKAPPADLSASSNKKPKHSRKPSDDSMETGWFGETALLDSASMFSASTVETLAAGEAELGGGLLGLQEDFTLDDVDMSSVWGPEELTVDDLCFLPMAKESKERAASPCIDGDSLMPELFKPAKAFRSAPESLLRLDLSLLEAEPIVFSNVFSKVKLEGGVSPAPLSKDTMTPMSVEETQWANSDLGLTTLFDLQPPPLTLLDDVCRRKTEGAWSFPLSPEAPGGGIECLIE